MNDMSTLGFALVLMGALAAQSTLILRVTGAQFRRVDDKFDALDQKFDALNEKFDAKIDALNDKFDVKFAASDRVLDARLGAINHRLDALESDMRLVKQHLLNPTAA